MCWCAVKKLLTHYDEFQVMIQDFYKFFELEAEFFGLAKSTES